MNNLVDGLVAWSKRAAWAGAGLMLAACATDGGGSGGSGTHAGASPHYKVGAPYRISGRTYRPRVDRGYNEVGLASWYGAAFQGKPTANGERFDRNLLTAAHKTLPMPTLVEVQNLENDRRIVVRVNDRGPFVDDRIIDLSEAAARRLGFREKGLARVRVSYVREAALPPPGRNELARAQTPPQPPRPADAPSPSPVEAAAVARAAQNDAPAAAPLETWIDVGAYGSFADVDRAHGALLKVLGDAADLAILPSGDEAFVLRLGPFPDRQSASAALSMVRGAGHRDAAIVDAPAKPRA